MSWNERQAAIARSKRERVSLRLKRGGMMDMAKLINNGIIVTATDHFKADILIEEGLFTRLA